MPGAGLTTLGLVIGTLVYVGADAWLSRDEEMKSMRRSGHAAAAGWRWTCRGPAPRARRGANRSRWAIFADGVPESVALGLTVADGELGVAMLAGILVGNVVEACGAAQPIVAARGFPLRAHAPSVMWLAIAFATVLGGTVLSNASPSLIGSAEAVAAGAVLAVVSIAVIPYAFSEVSSLVASATVAGFIAGYLLS
jgi:zinc transporter, ZIP family